MPKRTVPAAPLIYGVTLAVALILVAPPAYAQTGATTSSPKARLPLLIANLLLEQEELSDTIYLYESNDDVLLPVGELAQQLTLGITIDQVSHAAAGFLLKESAPFRLDPATGKVTLPTGQEDFDPRLVRWIDGELYVASRLLQRWWPVNFKFNMHTLSLQALPREKLPIQLKLEREWAAKRLDERGGYYADPGYPRLNNPYRFLTVPMVDNTIGLGVNKRGTETQTQATWTGVFSGDLLGMEANAYAMLSKDDPKSDARITLARNHPDGGLLGPLDATSFQLGNIGLPALKNVLTGSGLGWGSLISNRPLNQASSYGLQTLRGELPTGWDVTLYFNEALIAFAQSRGDGLYEFPDQPLVFGRNEFRLVFNGPLGQRRVETQVYIFDQTLTKPGEFYYTAGAKRDDDGTVRSTLQMDAGIAKGLAVTAGTIHINRVGGNRARTYLNAGVRASLPSMLINLDRSQDMHGGSVTEFGLRTSLQGVAVDASRTWVSNFISDIYTGSSSEIELRDQIRLTGVLAPSSLFRMPYALDFLHEKTNDNVSTYTVQPRISLNVAGTSFTNALDWKFGSGPKKLSGALQIGRRVAGIGINSQLTYKLHPNSQLESFALTVDKALGESKRLTFGLARTFRPADTTVTVGLTHNFHSFGLGLTGLYSGPHSYGLGIQIFTAFGRNPRNGALMHDWQPIASMGAVTAKVFLDGNMNGVWDSGEEPIENAGFTVNGSARLGNRTDDRGEAVLARLQPKAYADLALDLDTLDDAQWQPSQPGIRVLPRPGKVQSIDFPVVYTAEIDGTVYLAEDSYKRGIGNARLQLLDAAGKIVGETKTSSDGYYIVPSVKPGKYQLRIEPEQLTGIGLKANRIAEVEITPQGNFIHGVDFTLSKPQE